MNEIPRPGQIYYADIGADENKRVVIISTEQVNRQNYILVVRATSQRFEEYSRSPFCVAFRAGKFGFTENSVAKCDEIMMLHKAYVFADRVLGQLDGAAMRDVIKAMGFAIGADCEPSAFSSL